MGKVHLFHLHGMEMDTASVNGYDYIEFRMQYTFFFSFFYKITKSESQPGRSYGFGHFQAQMILKCF